MPRTLHLCGCPQHLRFEDKQVLTPHRAAARALDVPHRSLKSLALSVVRAHGYAVAPPLLAQRTLAATISDRSAPAEPLSVAKQMILPLQTILRTGIDAVVLQELGSQRVRELAAIAGEYQFRLRKQGYLDDSEVLWQASLLEPKRRPIFVYGYFRSRIEELAFINAVADDGSEMVLPMGDHAIFRGNHEGAVFLERHGWSPQSHSPEHLTLGYQLSRRFLGEDTADQVNVSSLEFPDLDAEVRATLSEIKKLLRSGVDPDEIALVTRDARLYGPKLMSISWEYELPVRVCYEIPLSETRVGSWVKLMLECLLAKFPYEDTLRLLFSPMAPELTVTKLHEARVEQPNNLSMWSNYADDLSTLVWPPTSTRQWYIDRLLRTLQVFAIRDQARYWAAEVQAYYNVIDEMHSIKDGLDETVSLEKFAEELSEILSVISVPLNPSTVGIELFEPHTVMGSTFQHLFVLGMADGVLPGPVAENPVIDFHERKQLIKHGIDFEEASAVARWEALSFYFLVQIATRSIAFSYPLNIEGVDHLPSSYLQKLGLQPYRLSDPPFASSVEEVRRIALTSDFETDNDSVIPWAMKSLSVETQRDTVGGYDEYSGNTGITLDVASTRWSVSQLRGIGQCPFRWFVERALRATVPEEPDSTISFQVLGKLYHKTLELAVSETPTGSDFREAINAGLEKYFSLAEQDKDVGLPRVPAWNAQRIEHIQKLKKAVEASDFLLPDAEVLGTELCFESECYGLPITGVVDRIDRNTDGLWLIDYKRGASVPPGVKDDRGQVKLDIQLPVYIDVAAPSLFPDTPVAGAYYYSITKAKKIGEADASPTQLEEFAQRVKAHLQNGYFPVEPDLGEKACTYCDHEMACRKGSWISRKKGTIT
jgi:RecB family exonuclease